jgi:hypothetical protein
MTPKWKRLPKTKKMLAPYTSTGEEGTPQEHTDGTVKYTYIEVQSADDSADLGDFGLSV